jgi:polar amino acid transport system permease protein
MEQGATAYSTGEILGLVWTICVGLGVAALAAKIFNTLFAWSQKPVEFGEPGAAKLNWVRFALAILLTIALSLGLLNVILEASRTADWTWFPKYFTQIVHGLYLTILLLFVSVFFGFLLAVPIGLVQVTGPWPLAWIARGFCTIIRGTPLLVQLWLLYYGLGSFFPEFPSLRQSFMWPILIEGFYYAALALTLSFAGYEGEIMRGAFLGVPKGELEAARAYGMTPFTVLRRVWLPRAFRIVLPTLGGEVISQLKSTPLASTVTVLDMYGVARKISSNTLRTYEPLIMIAIVYFVLVYFLNRVIHAVEKQVPQKR